VNLSGGCVCGEWRVVKNIHYSSPITHTTEEVVVSILNSHFSLQHQNTLSPHQNNSMNTTNIVL